MNRVRTVYGFRVWLNSPVVSGISALALMFAAGGMVSFGNIVANTMAHADVAEDVSYIASSLLHARTIVQIMAALIVLVAGLVAVNSARKVGRFVGSRIHRLRVA